MQRRWAGPASPTKTTVIAPFQERTPGPFYQTTLALQFRPDKSHDYSPRKFAPLNRWDPLPVPARIRGYIPVMAALKLTYF